MYTIVLFTPYRYTQKFDSYVMTGIAKYDADTAEILIRVRSIFIFLNKGRGICFSS